MKIIDAISNLDSLKQNTYTREDKIRWLSTVDETVKREIMDHCVGADQVSFSGYTTDTDVNTVLLIPAPYDEAYSHWMGAQIDLANGEYGKYNNAMEMFQTAYEGFKNYYNRTHMPKGKKFKFF